MAIGLFVLAGVSFGSGFYKVGGSFGVCGLLLCAYDLILRARVVSRQNCSEQELRRTIAKLTQGLKKEPGISFKGGQHKAPKLPVTYDYWEFLKLANGSQGHIGKTDQVQFWSLEKVIAANQNWETIRVEDVHKTYGLCLFGEKEDTRYAFRVQDGKVVIVSVSGDGEIKFMAVSFIEFLQKLHVGG